MNLQESIRNDLNKIDENKNKLPIGWKIDNAYAVYVNPETGISIDMAVGAATYEFIQANDYRATGVVPDLEVVSNTPIKEDEVLNIIYPFFTSFGEVKVKDVIFTDVDIRRASYVAKGYVKFTSKRNNVDDIDRMISTFKK